MKTFKVLLILMGVVIISLTVGFSLGMYTSFATGQYVRIETKSMNVLVSFKPGASNLMKKIGSASFLFYSEVLTACLNEPENVEKINSTRILADFIAGSCFVNSVRPRIMKKKDNSGGKESSGKFVL